MTILIYGTSYWNSFFSQTALSVLSCLFLNKGTFNLFKGHTYFTVIWTVGLRYISFSNRHFGLVQSCVNIYLCSNNSIFKFEQRIRIHFFSNYIKRDWSLEFKIRHDIIWSFAFKEKHCDTLLQNSRFSRCQTQSKEEENFNLIFHILLL